MYVYDSSDGLSRFSHLHNGFRMFPVKEHDNFLSKQFLLFRRNHPCSHLFGAQPPPRNMRRAFLHRVDELKKCTAHISDEANFRQALNSIYLGY